MAKIYAKSNSSLTTDNTLILDQREALVYPLPFSDWTEIRVGMFYSSTTGDADNDGLPNGSTISLSAGSFFDKAYFLGVKNNNQNFPTVNGECFAGLFTDSGFYLTQGSTNNNTIGNGTAAGRITTGSILGNGTINANGIRYYLSDYTFQTTQNYSYACCMVVSLKFVDKGLSTQKLVVKAITQEVSGHKQITDVGDQNLKNKMLTDVFDIANTADYNISGVPCPTPDAVFCYLPTTQVRLRIHNIAVLKIE